MNDQSEKKHVIATLSCDDKVVGFWGEEHTDGRHLPQQFNSQSEAEAAIKTYISEAENARASGNLSSCPSIDDFEVLEASDPEIAEILLEILLETFPDISKEEPDAPSVDQPSL